MIITREKITKSTSLTKFLRALNVGESVIIKHNEFTEYTVRIRCSGLNHQGGIKFSVTKKGLQDAVMVTRTA